jgi:hypothetical protein
MGAAAANELFLEQEPIVAAATPVGNGICQALSGYDVFDLKDFDGLNRDTSAKEPASISFTGGNTFSYKLC